ncbi:MAG: hypothetical protein V4441_12415 [Pseudomonadota bacterium]
MHMFPFFGALLHGTVLATLSFFVLFAASKADGRIKSFGIVLGTWLAILALIALVGLTFMSKTGGMGGMNSGMMQGSGSGIMQGSGQGMMQGAGPGSMHGSDGAQPDTTKP